MPAAKKPTDHRRSKPTDKPKSKQSSHATKPKQVNRVEETNNPSRLVSTPTTPPSTQSQPMPMPVTPGRLPSQAFAPLIRTTYNSIWLKRLGIVAGIGVVAGIGYTGWALRDRLPSFATLTDNTVTPTITQLTITPTPTPDPSKISRLSADINYQSSETASENIPADQASSSAQLTQSLRNQETTTLKQELNTSISNLDKKQVNTNNLRAYQSKISSLEAAGEAEQAREWLIEAVLHAHELEALQGYYE